MGAGSGDAVLTAKTAPIRTGLPIRLFRKTISCSPPRLPPPPGQQPGSHIRCAHRRLSVPPQTVLPNGLRAAARLSFILLAVSFDLPRGQITRPRQIFPPVEPHPPSASIRFRAIHPNTAHPFTPGAKRFLGSFAISNFFVFRKFNRHPMRYPIEKAPEISTPSENSMNPNDLHNSLPSNRQESQPFPACVS